MDVVPVAPSCHLAEGVSTPRKRSLASFGGFGRKPSKFWSQDDRAFPSTPYGSTSQREALTGALVRPHPPPKRALLSRLFSSHFHHHSVDQSERSTDKALHFRHPPRIPPGGDAARASVALSSQRRFELSRSRPAADCPSDADSGIAVDLAKSFAEMAFNNSAADPLQRLPQEVMENVFCNLDADSLHQVREVSQAWRVSASSQWLWRRNFERDYYPAPLPAAVDQSSVIKIGSAGIGTQQLQQEWHRMYQCRRAVERKWQEQSAAATYLTGHTDSVYCVQFDHEKIITGSRDCTMRVWDIKTFACLVIIGDEKPPPVPPFKTEDPIDYPGIPPTRVVYTPRITEPPPRRSLGPSHQGSILALRFDAKNILSASSDGTAYLWSIDHPRLEYRSIFPMGGRGGSAVLDVGFNDKYMVLATKSMRIFVWKRPEQERKWILRGHRGPVNAIQLRGEKLVSVSSDQTARLWDLGAGVCIREFVLSPNGLACVDVSPDARTLWAGGNAKTIYELDVETADMIREARVHAKLVRSIHHDHPSNRIVSGSYDGSVRVFDAQTGARRVNFEGWTTSYIYAVKADWRRIICGGQDARVVVMDFGWGVKDVALLDE